MTSQTGHVYEPFVAVGAGLWLLVVGLFVPSELLLRVKNFTTMANVILELFLDVKMVSILVLGKIGVPPKGLVAEIALDRSIASVAIRVFIEFLLGQKSFIAERTRKRFYTEMTLHVELEVLFAIEVLAALSAFEWMNL